MNTFANTAGEIELALEQRGLNPKRMKKDELIAYAATRAPDVVIWGRSSRSGMGVEQHKGQAAGERSRGSPASDQATEAVREHPDVGPLFSYGPDNVPMSEVSGALHRPVRHPPAVPGSTTCCPRPPST